MLFAALTLLLVAAAYTVGGAQAEEEGLNPLKVDQDFFAELSADNGLLYYDVIVAFNSKEDTHLLEVFGRDIKTFRVLPMARAVLNKEEIAEVTNWPEVIFVEPNRQLELFNSDGRLLTRSEKVQMELGFDGQSVELAIIDTGADGLHPDIEPNLLNNWQIIGSLFGDNAYVSSTADGINVQTDIVDIHAKLGTSYNTDEHGHGTHVFGTIAGTGDASEGFQRGMAPAAKVHSYSTSGGIFILYALEAYDHIIYQVKYNNVPIRLINNSWGTTGCNFNPNHVINIATRLAFQEGILSVFAYGNSGPNADTCNPYATAPYVLGIAATDKAYRITGFSSRGKTDGNHDRELALNNLYAFLSATPEERANWDFNENPVGVYRPSVAAPGQNIVSAQNPLHPMTLSGSYYGAASGTSMAAPHVTGVLALVLDAYHAHHPEQTLTPIDLIRLVEVTANKEVMFGFNTHDTGAGFIDAYAAVQRAINNDIPDVVSVDDLVRYELSASVQIESGQYRGEVLANSWQTNMGYGLHEVDVREGAMKLFADVSWTSLLENIYISLFAPGQDVENDKPVTYSAALLEINNYRFVEFSFPKPGTWKIRIDGRVNLITPYEGTWEVHYADNAPPSGSLEVTPERVGGNDSINITATVTDPDGIEDLVDVSLKVISRNGRSIASWTKDDFNVVDNNTLNIKLHEVRLRGNHPWKVVLTAKDSKNNVLHEDTIVYRK
ncbi:S8 family serine peptidase [Caldalkalibacillus thermarum TA2.A1]|nr:S8 family serine peptidase [Caldalkalibacillus thermarum TA2.A1]